MSKLKVPKYEYLVVNDYNSGEVYIYNLRKHKLHRRQSEDYEKFLADEGFQLSNCDWMITNKINIQ